MATERLIKLIKVFQAAKKAAESDEEERCIDALSLLKNFHITVDLLISTKIAHLIRISFASHSSKKIRNLALEVLATWKSFVLNQQSRRHKKPISDNYIYLPKLDSLPKTDNPTRDKIREQVFKALCLVFSEDDENRALINRYDPVKVSVSVESALFMEWGLSNNRSKYRSLLFNIKDPNNPDFRRKILVGEIKAEQVGKLSALEMASDKRKQENEEIKERYMNKKLIQRNKDGEKGTTNAFKCGKCGKRETTYRQLQTRSADEPMTTYVTCMNCDHRWKFC